MMIGNPGASRAITKYEKREDGLLLVSERGKLRLTPVSDEIIRVTYTEEDDFTTTVKDGILPYIPLSEWKIEESGREIIVSTAKCTVTASKENGAVSFFGADGRLLLQEKAGGKSVERFQTYKLCTDAAVKKEVIVTADGEKEIIREAAKEPNGFLYHTRISFLWEENEALYGLGQQEEGLLNLRGHTVYVHQANRKIAIPVLVSTKGYGLLMNTESPMIFRDDAYGSYLYGEACEELDYFFLAGGNPDGVVKRYRELTGKAALLPKWAFGYLQSQERFESAEEMVRIGAEYRKRGLGLDALILDWMSWPDGMWGQKSFDPLRFPNPAELTKELHEMDIKWMISVWPNMAEVTANHKEMKEHGLLLPAGNIYNALSKEGRDLYFKQAEEGIYRYGVDGWWCDSSEPVTPEWSHKEKPDPAVMYQEYCRDIDNLISLSKGNAFSFYHAKALYEGQRACDSEKGVDKRVTNLTRSGYTGQQRYGTILWSGDTAASWETLRTQIPAGLNFCASGLPFWTVDIGAFFVREGDFWYWKGEYPQADKDRGYRELFTRWYQWGAYLPVFRGHGTDCRRELWEFEDKEENIFYEALVRANRRRYEMMPYIYSLAGKAAVLDESMIKPLAFAFPEESEVYDMKDQYLFGDSLMICPVTTPMYYEAGNRALTDAEKTRKVYLPKGGWYNFETGQYYEGGRWIEADAPIDYIPVFVREGTILPLTKEADRTKQKDEIVFTVFGGKDAEYLLYEDAGDGYGYERGEYRLTKYTYCEQTKTLTDDNGNMVPIDRLVTA